MGKEKTVEHLLQMPDICEFHEARDGTLHLCLVGPIGSVYEGGVFPLHILLPQIYPFERCIYSFANPLFHPNIVDSVFKNNKIDCTWLGEETSPAMNLSKEIVALFARLMDPLPVKDDERLIARLYREQPNLFAQYARAWTRLYTFDAEGISKQRRDMMTERQAWDDAMRVFQDMNMPFEIEKEILSFFSLSESYHVKWFEDTTLVCSTKDKHVLGLSRSNIIEHAIQKVVDSQNRVSNKRAIGDADRQDEEEEEEEEAHEQDIETKVVRTADISVTNIIHTKRTRS